MKRLSLFAILSATLLVSCEQKSFTNEFSGTIRTYGMTNSGCLLIQFITGWSSRNGQII